MSTALSIDAKKVHYLRLWKAADLILKQDDNPCKISRDDQGRVGCTRFPHEMNVKDLCCSGCPHLGPDGCQVESLSCKLGWCYVSAGSITGTKVGDHPTFQKIAALKEEAIKLGIPLRFRASLNESF